MPHSGECLCGSCKINISSTFDSQIICHCTDCQKTSGSNYSTNIIANESDIKITGPVKKYGQKMPSGNIVDRFFCGNCGSALAHKSPVFGDARAIQTGNLPDFAKIPVGTELFVKSRWPVISKAQGATQCWMMPGSEPPVGTKL